MLIDGNLPHGITRLSAPKGLTGSRAELERFSRIVFSTFKRADRMLKHGNDLGLERARSLGTVETAVSKWPLGQGSRVSLILREGRRGVPNSRERVPFFPRRCGTRRRGPGWESSAPSLGARRVCVRRPNPASPRPRSLTRLRVQFGTAARWAAWSSRVLGLAPDASAALALCTCRDGRPSFFHRRADAPRSR